MLNNFFIEYEWLGRSNSVSNAEKIESVYDLLLLDAEDFIQTRLFHC